MKYQVSLRKNVGTIHQYTIFLAVINFCLTFRALRLSCNSINQALILKSPNNPQTNKSIFCGKSAGSAASTLGSVKICFKKLNNSRFSSSSSSGAQTKHLWPNWLSNRQVYNADHPFRLFPPIRNTTVLTVGNFSNQKTKIKWVVLAHS